MKKPIITFDEFEKIDLRIGEIKICEKIDKSEKLLRLIVDFGEIIGQRQILSGISKFYKSDDLVGKQVVAIINLESKQIMGMESCGMLLATGEEEISLLTTDRKINNGEMVR